MSTTTVRQRCQCARCKASPCICTYTLSEAWSRRQRGGKTEEAKRRVRPRLELEAPEVEGVENHLDGQVVRSPVQQASHHGNGAVEHPVLLKSCPHDSPLTQPRAHPGSAASTSLTDLVARRCLLRGRGNECGAWANLEASAHPTRADPVRVVKVTEGA